MATTLDLATALHNLTGADKVRCLELVRSGIRNLNHGTQVFLSATGGTYKIDTVQLWLRTVDEGCSPKCAANRLVMQRNPGKYGVRIEDQFPPERMRAIGGSSRRAPVVQSSEADISAWLDGGGTELTNK